MVLLHTPEKTNNFRAPGFTLGGVDGEPYSLEQCKGPEGFVVMFICNHCPYVLAVIDRLVDTCKTLQEEGIGCVAIMANDTKKYPDDSFDNMKLFSEKHGFTFPYLIDETQEIAKAYDAVCTPDFFGFDKDGVLQYRGRLDSAANKPVDEGTVPELLNAMRAIRENGTVLEPQHSSMGCSIKWKE